MALSLKSKTLLAFEQDCVHKNVYDVNGGFVMITAGAFRKRYVCSIFGAKYSQSHKTLGKFRNGRFQVDK